MRRRAVALVLCAAAAGACASGGRGDAPPAAVLGCFGSRAAWSHFGNPAMADTQISGWLVLDLRRARGAGGARIARTFGPDDDRPYPAVRTWVGMWRPYGDSLRVTLGNVSVEMEMRVAIEGDSLRGEGRHISDAGIVDSTGAWIPDTRRWVVRAVRVPCEQVPPRLERLTRNREPPSPSTAPD